MIETPVISARDISKTYRRRGLDGEQVVRSLDGVSIDVKPREIQALVGPSGSGKSTLGRCLAWLEFPDSGEILVEGRRPEVHGPRRLAEVRRAIQMVFQDPARSVNPRFTVAETLLEPYRIARALFGSPLPGRSSLESLLAEVDISASKLDERARSLSGGQLQRLVLARALATEPKVLVLDESLSGLDLSLRARLVNLLLEIVERRSLACLLITHDPQLASQLADRISGLRSGKMVEPDSAREGSLP